MKTSLNWLNAHLDLSSHRVEELRDMLTFAGIEVEGIEQSGVESDKIVVAQIVSFEQHPNADRLSVCQVDDGSGQPRQIVCGAKNFKAGDKVPLALPGATLPGGIEIKEGKLREVLSQGMLCSAKELGVGEDQGGLWILEAGLKVGTPMKELVASDVIFDLEVTPNRPDLLSHTGLARELAALSGKTLVKSDEMVLPVSEKAGVAEIHLAEPAICPFYTLRRIEGVKVGPSPEWLQTRLQSIGLRPINNVVDITNYVLFELGQPLHAFDAAKLVAPVTIRRANEGEKLVALDGNEYALLHEDLVIADNNKALAIAGVMGGEESGVVEGTTDILLEAAYFNPSSVRRTARRLALSSDSSYRFERGVDPQAVIRASALATQLILQTAGGKASETLLVAGEAPVLTQPVVLDEDRARRLIGIADLARTEIHRILTSLGLVKTDETDSTSTWTVPSYRNDLQRPVDLIEELARVIGLDRVPSKASGVFVPAQSADKTYDFMMQVRHGLTNRGFFEAQTLRLVSKGQLSDVLAAKVDAVALKNPLSEDHTHLRPGLIPGLLATAGHNIRQGLAGLRFFELGRVFLLNPNGSSREEERLGVLLSGPAHAPAWNAKTPAVADIHALRGVLESLPGMAGQGVLLVPKPLDGWLLSAEIKRGSKTLGWIAQVAPARARQLDARHPIYVAELAVSALQQGQVSAVKFSDLPRYPSVTRDVALEVAADLPHATVAAFFEKQKEPLLVGAELFDVFVDASGEKLARDKKSIAWRLTYRSSERTLATKEVDETHQRVLKALVGTVPATIR
jgi:phenylalanyl-tRNA synthetase beta chain